MKISENGKNLIKSFEGCRLEPYYCPSGVLTIGWGRTGKGVYPGQVITQEQADQFFDEDIVTYERHVQKYDYLNQNQYDALVSFTYNCGQGALQDVMSSGDITGTMELYHHGNGGVDLAGLVRRRKAEIDLFNTPVVGGQENPNRYTEFGTFKFTTEVQIRREPTNTNGIGVSYYPGETVNYKEVIVNHNGFNWIVYTSDNGKDYYLKIKDRKTGEQYGYVIA